MAEELSENHNKALRSDQLIDLDGVSWVCCVANQNMDFALGIDIPWIPSVQRACVIRKLSFCFLFVDTQSIDVLL